VRFKDLSDLKRRERYDIPIGTLPDDILIARYAMAKAFKISELIRAIHKESYEWYGYTIANRGNPELVIDVGLPTNDQNLTEYTMIGPARIAEFQESLPREQVINGWIHSHGCLEYEQFSCIDEQNQVTVLDYVSTLVRKPIAKQEIVIRDLALLVEGNYAERDLEKGSVSLVTDAPVAEARILETVYGAFCYAIVIGDSGWHRQQIHYHRRGILSGQAALSKKEAALLFVDTGRVLSQADVEALSDEVREKIHPTSSRPERFEKGCT
jgi:hypothetical protein